MSDAARTAILFGGSDAARAARRWKYSREVMLGVTGDGAQLCACIGARTIIHSPALRRWGCVSWRGWPKCSMAVAKDL